MHSDHLNYKMLKGYYRHFKWNLNKLHTPALNEHFIFIQCLHIQLKLLATVPFSLPFMVLKLTVSKIPI